MSSLERFSPLGVSVAGRMFENEFVSLRDERFIGIAKVVAKTISAEEDRKLLRELGIDGDLEPLRVMHGSTLSIAWLSPRERLLIGDERIVDNMVIKLTSMMSITALPIHLNHQCISVRLSGESARQVLSSLTPKDFNSDIFEVDCCLRTLFGECGLFVQRLAGDSDFRLIIDQSYAAYAWRMLEDACQNVKASALIGENT